MRRTGSESIVETVPARAIGVGFGSRATRLSNVSDSGSARHAWEAMKHAMLHALATGAADSVVRL